MSSFGIDDWFSCCIWGRSPPSWDVRGWALKKSCPEALFGVVLLTGVGKVLLGIVSSKAETESLVFSFLSEITDPLLLRIGVPGAVISNTLSLDGASV